MQKEVMILTLGRTRQMQAADPSVMAVDSFRQSSAQTTVRSLEDRGPCESAGYDYIHETCVAAVVQPLFRRSSGATNIHEPCKVKVKSSKVSSQ